MKTTMKNVLFSDEAIFHVNGTVNPTAENGGGGTKIPHFVIQH